MFWAGIENIVNSYYVKFESLWNIRMEILYVKLETYVRDFKETEAADINIIIICRKMLAEAIARIRFLMDKIKGKKISDLFQD